MPIEELTTINPDIDLFLFVTNLLGVVLAGAVIVALVFATRKMGQKLCGSVYWVVLSLVTISFFKNYVVEFFSQLISNFGFILYYSYIILSKRFYLQVLNLLIYAALVACPLVLRLVAGLFCGRPIRNEILTRAKFMRASRTLFTVAFARPSFHFIS